MRPTLRQFSRRQSPAHDKQAATPLATSVQIVDTDISDTPLRAYAIDTAGGGRLSHHGWERWNYFIRHASN